MPLERPAAADDDAGTSLPRTSCLAKLMACVKFFVPLSTDDLVIISRSLVSTSLTSFIESSDFNGVVFCFLVDEASCMVTSSSSAPPCPCPCPPASPPRDRFSVPKRQSLCSFKTQYKTHLACWQL